LSDLDL
jgi:hypothetical protein